MRKINLICVGNLKENYLKEAVLEYQKRLSKFFDFKIIEIPEYKLKNNNEILKGLDIEAESILEKLKGQVCTLCIEGKELSSPEFADFVSAKTDVGELSFVIGSSFGLSTKVKNLGTKLSFGKMTFPHQLMRVIFLEQLYRAGTILNGTTYHK